MESWVSRVKRIAQHHPHGADVEIGRLHFKAVRAVDQATAQRLGCGFFGTPQAQIPFRTLIVAQHRNELPFGRSKSRVPNCSSTLIDGYRADETAGSSVATATAKPPLWRSTRSGLACRRSMPCTSAVHIRRGRSRCLPARVAARLHRTSFRTASFADGRPSSHSRCRFGTAFIANHVRFASTEHEMRQHFSQIPRGRRACVRKAVSRWHRPHCQRSPRKRRVHGALISVSAGASGVDKRRRILKRRSAPLSHTHRSCASESRCRSA